MFASRSMTLHCIQFAAGGNDSLAAVLETFYELCLRRRHLVLLVMVSGHTVQVLANLHRVDIPTAAAAPNLDPAPTAQSPTVTPPARTDKGDLASLHSWCSFVIGQVTGPRSSVHPERESGVD
jgi:hypothetical protein